MIGFLVRGGDRLADGVTESIAWTNVCRFAWTAFDLEEIQRWDFLIAHV
jgi:hypothetical protein